MSGLLLTFAYKPPPPTTAQRIPSYLEACEKGSTIAMLRKATLHLRYSVLKMEDLRQLRNKAMDVKERYLACPLDDYHDSQPIRP